MLGTDSTPRVEGSPRGDRELLERIIDTIPVMITIYDPGTRMVRVNREFERLVGWSTEEVAGISLMAACYPDPAYRRRVAE
jgi:PAS domain S-box-containing protein